MKNMLILQIESKHYHHPIHHKPIHQMTQKHHPYKNNIQNRLKILLKIRKIRLTFYTRIITNQDQNEDLPSASSINNRRKTLECTTNPRLLARAAIRDLHLDEMLKSQMPKATKNDHRRHDTTASERRPHVYYLCLLIRRV